MRRRRGHQPERDAARYLSGEGRRRWRDRFESHLVVCEACWAEVQLGRRGRALAERARELAPPPLREQVRAEVEMSESGRSWPRRLRARVAATALAGIVAGGGLSTVFALRGGSGQPEAIAAAVASYRSNHLPLSGLPARRAPDLSSVGLVLAAGGRTDLGGVASDAFTYRSGGGAVFLFLGSRTFPEAMGARERLGPMPGWEAMTDGVAIVCSDSPVSYLLMSDDPFLLSEAEATLRDHLVSLEG